MATDLGVLLVQISDGNIKAFETFYKMYHFRMFMYARKFINDKEVIQDLLQDFFSGFWENRASINMRQLPETYFFRCIHNKCVDYLRTSCVRHDFIDLSDLRLNEIKSNYYLDEANPFSSIFVSEIESIVDKLIEELPDQCRLVFELSRKKGLSNQEIADHLNISVRTVESHVYKVLKLLKRSLSEYLSFLIYLYFSSRL